MPIDLFTREEKTILSRLSPESQERWVLLKEIETLQNCIRRMKCGCLSLDCTKHGSYNPTEVEMVEEILKNS